MFRIVLLGFKYINGDIDSDHRLIGPDNCGFLVLLILDDGFGIYYSNTKYYYIKIN
jgi:hypothetical protein